MDRREKIFFYRQKIYDLYRENKLSINEENQINRLKEFYELKIKKLEAIDDE